MGHFSPRYTHRTFYFFPGHRKQSYQNKRELATSKSLKRNRLFLPQQLLRFGLIVIAFMDEERECLHESTLEFLTNRESLCVRFMSMPDEVQSEIRFGKSLRPATER